MSTIQTVLHPTDFSGRSSHALRVACTLARDHEARLILLHVLPEAVLTVDELGTRLVPPSEEQRKAALDQLRSMKPIGQNLDVDCRIAEGAPAATVLRVAGETAADLIVLGTHGRTGLTRLVMGSVAEEVVRKAPCPVLAVKETASEDWWPVQAILHPTDFSRHSQEAFRLACALARGPEARLIILHVRAPSKVLLDRGVPVVDRPGRQDTDVEASLRRIKPPDPDVRVELRTERGNPAEEIIRVARATESGLIVMGAHGRTGLSRLLIGSVAEQVVRHAPCPVLIVKTPLRREGGSEAQPARGP